MGGGQSTQYQSKESKIFDKIQAQAESKTSKKTKRDGTVLRTKQEILADYDSSSLPYPLKPLLKLDYCWRLNYTMFRHAFVLAGPLSLIHFLWTQSPACWNLTLRTIPYRAIFRNYAVIVALITSINTTWSLVGEDYW